MMKPKTKTDSTTQVYKGICYKAFPKGYDPLTANDTCIFSGSDIACNPMKPLWGTAYTSGSGSSCGASGANCRDDLQTIANLGINLVKLYDWDPRNSHTEFLDYCQSFGINVLVPVSNYFLTAGYQDKDANIIALIKSFSNAGGTDYHPAIIGIAIGNEPYLGKIDMRNLIDFTNSWVKTEQQSYPGFRQLKITHPVSFKNLPPPDEFSKPWYPAWTLWREIIAGVTDVNDRLVLSTNTFNHADYLFENAGGPSGKSYVDLSYEKFKLPLLFTEIGQDRTVPNYQEIVTGQLSGTLKYNASNPDVLLGCCFFQFADKVWLPHTESEGAFWCLYRING